MEPRSTEEGEKRLAPFGTSGCPEVLDILDEGILHVGRDLRLIYVNASGAELLGRRYGELRGRTVREAVPGSWCPPLAEELKKALEESRKASFEVYCPGSVHLWLHCRCLPVDGGIAVAMQDITKWKAREEQSAESRRKMQLEMDELNAIYCSAPIGLCVLDTDLRYVKINDFLAGINGRPASEHIGRTPREMAPAYTDEMEETIRSVIATGEPRLGMELAGKDLRGRGRLRSFMTNWLPLKDEGGKVIGVNVVVEDISERKLAEDALRVSGENYRAIFDSANDAIFIHDARDGAIIDANSAASEMYGYTAEEMHGLRVSDISSGEEPYALEEALRKINATLQEARQPAFVWRAKDKWGQPFWVEVSLKLTVINGEQRIIALVRDITRRRHLEEALKLSEERFRLIAESMPQLVWTTGPDGKADYFNTHYKDYSGVDPFTPGAPNPIHPDDAERTREAWDRSMLTGREYKIEHRVRRADGVYRWHLSQGIPVRDEAGGIVRWYGTATDIDDQKLAQDTLRAAKERYRILYASMAQGVLEYDGQGRLLSSNRAALEITGLDLEGMRGFAMTEAIDRAPGADQAGRDTCTYLELAYAHAASGRPLMNQETRIRNPKTGEWAWVLMDAIPRLEPGEEVPDSVFIILTDITRIKEIQGSLSLAKMNLEEKVRERTGQLDRSNRLLEEQKEILQKIIDNIPVMIVLYEPSGKPKMVNREFSRIMGWSLAEVQGRDILVETFPDPAEREGVRSFIMSSETGWRDLEPKMRSGSTLPSSWANIRLSDGSLIGIGIDISARKKMELDLLRLVSAIEQAGEGVAVLDEGWAIEYVNPAFERIFGYSRDELTGLSVNCLRENFIDDAGWEAFNRALLLGRTWSSHQKGRKQGGEKFEATLTVSPVQNEKGTIINHVCIVRDVTREAKLQQQMIQSQKLEAIGTLAGGIAHDLKNIFTPIVLNTEMALEDLGGDSPSKPLLEETLQAARMGADFTRQIVTFSSRSTQEYKRVKIFQVVNEALMFLKSTLPVNVELKHLVEDSDALVVADSTQIKQVMLNLGNNAGHALKDRGGTLEVRLSEALLEIEETAEAVSPGLAPGKYACIEFKDNGVGMDDRILQHIFEPFFTTKAKGEGTGMGLAVVHAIVKDHKGAITVRSRPGDGTTFRVYLPIAAG
jgi:PAS domain S-box-containing protein